MRGGPRPNPLLAEEFQNGGPLQTSVRLPKNACFDPGFAFFFFSETIIQHWKILVLQWINNFYNVLTLKNFIHDLKGLLLRVEDAHDVTKALGVFRDLEF